jgi:hypothetical protein
MCGGNFGSEKSYAFVTSVPLEILHFALVFLRGAFGRKGAEIAPFAGARIFLARIQPIFAGGEFADHEELPRSELNRFARGAFL